MAANSGPTAITISQQNKTDTPSNANGTVEDLVRHYVLMTPYPVGPGHTLISIVRIPANQWKPEMKANASYVAQGDNAGIIINKSASIMDYNKSQASQKERLQPPNSKMSFKVYLINSETGKLSLEHRTLRFWMNQTYKLDTKYNSNNNNNDCDQNGADDDYKSIRCYANMRQESSQIAQSYFRQLIGSTSKDDFPKNYSAFLMKLMRLLKSQQFDRVCKMEVELRQLAQDDLTSPPSRACKYQAETSSSFGLRRLLISLPCYHHRSDCKAALKLHTKLTGLLMMFMIITCQTRCSTAALLLNIWPSCRCAANRPNFRLQVQQSGAFKESESHEIISFNHAHKMACNPISEQVWEYNEHLQTC